MQEKATIARPYAEAAFAQAREEGDLRRWSELLQVLGMVVSDPRMRRVIGDPRLGEERLYQLLADICGDRLHPTGANFLRILIRSRRIGLAPEIYRMFEDSRAEAEGVARVHVIAAYDVDDQQRNRIVEAMTRRLGRKIEITSTTDQSLIGGAIIRSGDSVIDASVRGLLERLRIEFAH